MHLSLKRRNKAIFKHSKDLKEIWDMYHKKEVFINKVRDKEKKVVYYTFNVDEIISKFNIKTIAELIFLLHVYGGEIIKDCEFCGQKTTKVSLRTSTSVEGCSCRGICTVCEEIYSNANEDGVCYNCRPFDLSSARKFSDENVDVRYRFLRAVGDHYFIQNMDSIDESQKMMEMASYYYYLFKEKKDFLMGIPKLEE